ncbi:hypothetical protein DPMN_189861 [Dreissena polymorpha]|uniref:Uncharacterized protein n=1 Tax=Dreissena polymorpha TaxID=45954 RepID=A0A9D4DTW2_DREPO|nr:hypothetical protein DPMN_189861 [Dreissena polymorpha]
MKNAPPPGSHVLQPTRTILTFHEDRTLNVASRVHVLQPTRKIFKHVQDIIGKNLLTKFHEDWTINVASRENAPPPGGHVFQPTETILDLVQDINGKNYLTKFHKDWTINIATRVLTRQMLILHDGLKAITKAHHAHAHYTKELTCSVQPQDIIRTKINVLTKFYEERNINVTIRVITRRNSLTPDILKTIVLTKFYEDWTINVTIRVSENAPSPGGYVMQPTGTIFKLVQDIVGTNLLTKFHYDQAINVASRVLTRENAPPPGGHLFQQTGTIFELVQNIIGTNLLTKFHEDWKINVITSINKPFNENSAPWWLDFSINWNNFELFHVASRVLTRKKNTPWRPCFSTNFELVQNIIGTNLLTKKNAPPPGRHVFSSKHDKILCGLWSVNNANGDTAQHTKDDDKSSP